MNNTSQPHDIDLHTALKMWMAALQDSRNPTRTSRRISRDVEHGAGREKIPNISPGSK